MDGIETIFGSTVREVEDGVRVYLDPEYRVSASMIRTIEQVGYDFKWAQLRSSMIEDETMMVIEFEEQC